MILKGEAMESARNPYFTRFLRNSQMTGYGALWCWGNFRRVTRLMVLDLKAQESMHGLQGLRVFGRDADARAARCVFQLILNLLSQLFHGFRSRRILRVDSHRRRKISFRKH